MKALVLEEYNKFAYKEVNDPEINSGDVLIRIKACSICGSDVHGYDGTSGRRRPPLILGHEASGVVEEVGASVTKFKKGDRVVFNSTLYCRDCDYCKNGLENLCRDARIYGVSTESYRLNGAMCEFISVPEYIVYLIPDTISFEQAALIEPLSIAVHAVNQADIKLNDTAVVFGAGTIGLLIAKLLNISSCKEVILVDLDEQKLAVAKASGIDTCLNPVTCDVNKEILAGTENNGAELVFEAVGINTTFSQSLNCIKKSGQLIVVGNISPKIELSLQTLVTKEIKLIGSNCCTTEYKKSIELISSGRLDITDCISKVAPLKDGQFWFDKLHDDGKGLLRVVLQI